MAPIALGWFAAAACAPAEIPVQVELRVELPDREDGHGPWPEPAAAAPPPWISDPSAIARARLDASTEARGPAWLSATARPTRDGEVAATHVPRPPTTAAELDALLAAIASVDHDEALDVARNLAAATAGAWPAIRAALLAERKASKTEYRRMLEVIGGDVPNRYGHFELAWKRAHGYPVKLSDDWFEDLLGLASSRISRAIRAVYRDTLATAALLRAAARLGATEPSLVDEVIETLLDAAYVHGGTFRDEVGRAIVAVGDPAIPALLRASRLPDPLPRDLDRIDVKRAQYALHNLDRLDRLQPQRALASVRDRPALLVQTLDAYAVALLADAPALLLAWVDDLRPDVRAAARRAFLASVAPEQARRERKALRLLGGGTAEGGHQTGYDLGAKAVEDALAHRDPEALEPPCALWRSDGTTDPDCAARPTRHAQALFAALDRARREHIRAEIFAVTSLADPELALARLEPALASSDGATEPDLLIPLILRAVERAEARADVERAAQLLRKAAALREADDPAKAQRLRSRALVYEAMIASIPESGRAMLRAAARELAGDDPWVAERLAAAGERAALRLPRPAPVITAGGLAAWLAMVGLGLATRVRPRRA